MKIWSATLGGLLCLYCTLTHAQTQHPVFLHRTEPTWLTPVYANARSLTPWPQNNCVDDKCYAIIQFDGIPDAQTLQELTALGIQLYDFIPDFAYLASLDATTSEVQLPALVVGIGEVRPEYKRSPLPVGWASTEADGVYKYLILPFRGFGAQALYQQLQLLGYTTVNLDTIGVYARLSEEELTEVLEHPGVMYAEPIDLPSIPEGNAGRSSIGINAINRGPGAGYDGQNVTIGIADDGRLLHLDFKGRVIDLTVAGAGNNHGEMTAGMAMGAGNLNPWAMGGAPGARLVLTDIANYDHLANAPSYLSQYGMVITSTSYGEGCGGVYSLPAQQLDLQVMNYPVFFHVFSAGNSSMDACPTVYGSLTTADGARFGNITGGRKAAKNVLTVGNLMHTDLLRSTSSRGPTADGRVKPDMCAQGQGSLAPDENNGYRQSSGTSAAAPMVAGGIAGLYQYYRQANDGQDPSSALIKGILLNTADDLGQPGPDFYYGWGKTNFPRALQCLQSGRYLSGSLVSGAQAVHPLTVQSGVKELRVMLYWHDKPGSPLASKTLVNDLDLRLLTPAGQQLLPWSPSTAPFADSLGSPAVPRTDRVNNVEQVRVLNPAAGAYNVQISGYQIPQGAQSYYIVYEFVMDDLSITYPLANEAILSGETCIVRWDAPAQGGTFILESSLNGGASWQAIAANIPANQRYFEWNVPVGSYDQAALRLRRGTLSDVKTGLVASPAPQFNVQYHSASQARILWTPIAGAIGYEVFAMGTQYMEPIGTTQQSEWLMPASLGTTYWISVRAIFPSGKRGPRAVAQSYIHQGCGYNMTLVLNFDQYPGETSWRIRAADGAMLASGGPYASQAPYSQQVISFCLPAGCFDFIIADAYGDGICCNNGNGSFALIGPVGEIIASGGAFGALSNYSFCTQEESPLQIVSTGSGMARCAERQDGWASVTAGGGTGTYTYHWSNGMMGSYVSGLASGTYSVTVTDGLASVSTTIVVTAPSALSYTLSSLNANCSNGMLSVVPSGGTAPYQLYWQTGQTGNTISGLAAGTYGFTLTDAYGCTLPAVGAVAQGEPLSFQANVLQPSCAQLANGAIAVQVSGGQAPYTYAWNNGSTLHTIANLAPGGYALTVYDSRGCQAHRSFAIEAPPVLSIVLAGADASPFQGGSIVSTVSGGSAPYVYAWSNGSTAPQLSNLAPGSYGLTVTDNNGCTAVATRSIVMVGTPAFCESRGASTSFEWIQKVKVNNNEVISGNNGGYGNYLNLTFILQKGVPAQIELTPGYASQAYNEHWRVFIDYNQDGDFLDADETVVTGGPSNQTIVRLFTPPNSAATGYTRMRISMQYGGAPSACGNLGYGEVEDYTVFIQPMQTNLQSPMPIGGGVEADSENIWQLWPNPVTGEAVVNIRGFRSTPFKPLEWKVYSAAGQWVLSGRACGHAEICDYQIDAAMLPDGVYWIELTEENKPISLLRFIRKR